MRSPTPRPSRSADGDTHIDSFTVHSLDGTAEGRFRSTSTAPTTPPPSAIRSRTMSPRMQRRRPCRCRANDGRAMPTTTSPPFSTHVASAAGNLGQLTITADGHYTYSVDNAAGAEPRGGRSPGRDLHRLLGRRHAKAGIVHDPRHPGCPGPDGRNDASGADDAPISLSIAAHLVDDSGTLGADHHHRHSVGLHAQPRHLLRRRRPLGSAVRRRHAGHPRADPRSDAHAGHVGAARVRRIDRRRATGLRLSAA